jgi:hypothetical protein
MPQYKLTHPTLSESGVFICRLEDAAGKTRAILSRSNMATGGSISPYDMLPPATLASVAYAFSRAQRYLATLSPVACMASFARGHVVPPDASLPLPPARKLGGKGQG